MAYQADRADVRSHRKSPAQRRSRRLSLIIGAVVVVLLGGGAAYGLTQLAGASCNGTVTAKIVASPSTAALLQSLAKSWTDSDPTIAGRCARVQVAGQETASMAQALGTDWDAKAGSPPDVWVPDSTAWVRRASTAAIAERMMPDLQPSWPGPRRSWRCRSRWRRPSAGPAASCPGRTSSTRSPPTRRAGRNTARATGASSSSG